MGQSVIIKCTNKRSSAASSISNLISPRLCRDPCGSKPAMTYLGILYTLLPSVLSRPSTPSNSLHLPSQDPPYNIQSQSYPSPTTSNKWKFPPQRITRRTSTTPHAPLISPPIHHISRNTTADIPNESISLIFPRKTPPFHPQSRPTASAHPIEKKIHQPAQRLTCFESHTNRLRSIVLHITDSTLPNSDTNTPALPGLAQSWPHSTDASN